MAKNDGVESSKEHGYGEVHPDSETDVEKAAKEVAAIENQDRADTPGSSGGSEQS